MKLLLLHGAPATGKLTVAKALLARVPGRLIDNHASIDLARTIFEFDAPGFWELVHDVRYSTIDAAAGTALTCWSRLCYVHPDGRAHLRCSMRSCSGTAAKCCRCFCTARVRRSCRVANPDRVERRKMSSAERLLSYLDRYEFSPVPRPDCLTLDTEARPADATAQMIISHFGLGAA